MHLKREGREEEKRERRKDGEGGGRGEGGREEERGREKEEGRKKGRDYQMIALNLKFPPLSLG